MCFIMHTFCFFLSLEVGTQIISIVSTLLSVFIAVLYSAAAVCLTLSQTKLVFYITMAAVGGLQSIFSMLLSYGAFQRRSMFMWPWLVTSWVTGGGLLVVSIAGSGALIIGGQLSNDVNIVIFAYVIYSLFILYCATVVNSRRVELLKEKVYLDNAEALMRQHHNSWGYY